MVEALAAAVLASLMTFDESSAWEPAVDDWQLLWPLKLNDWFRAMTALANSVSSLMMACRTATRPVMAPSTKMVATNTHSVAINAPASSCHNRCIKGRIKRNLLPAPHWPKE